jgi:hypothetical protein
LSHLPSWPPQYSGCGELTRLQRLPKEGRTYRVVGGVVFQSQLDGLLSVHIGVQTARLRRSFRRLNPNDPSNRRPNPIRAHNQVMPDAHAVGEDNRIRLQLNILALPASALPPPPSTLHIRYPPHAPRATPHASPPPPLSAHTPSTPYANPSDGTYNTRRPTSPHTPRDQPSTRARPWPSPD